VESERFSRGFAGGSESLTSPNPLRTLSETHLNPPEPKANDREKNQFKRSLILNLKYECRKKQAKRPV